MNIRIRLLILTGWIVTCSARGDTSHQYSVNEAIATALANNPTLQVAQHEIAAAEARLRYAGRLDNPALDLSFRNDQFGEDEGEQAFEVSLSQALPLTARLRKEKQLRKSQVELAKAEVAIQQLKLAHAVEQAMLHSMVLKEKSSTQNKLTKVNEEIVTFLQAQVDQGEASTLDVTQATIIGRKLEQESRLLAASQRVQNAKLNRLLGLDPTESIGLDLNLSLPENWSARALSREALFDAHPAHALANLNLQAARQAIQLEKSRRLDDVELRLFVEQEETVDEPIGLGENTIAGLGLSIPLPLMNRNRSAVAQAEVQEQRALSELRKQEFTLWSDYRQTRQACLDAYTLAREINTDLLSLAEQNFNALRQAYRQGQTSLTQVQRAQEQVLELRADALEATEQFFTQQSKLRRITAEYPLPVAE